MNWNYISIFFIGTIIGFAISLIFINIYYFKKLKLIKKLNFNFKKNNYETKKYPKELINCFSDNIKLLKNISADFHRIYQDMIYISNKFLSNQCINSFSKNNLTELEANNDQIPKEIKFNNH